MARPERPTLDAAGVIHELRRRPELVVGPAWVAWLLINCLPVTFGQPFILSVVSTALGRGSAGQAFPVTYGLAVALFVYALFVLPNLNLPRRVMVAAAIPFAFTHLYEVPYDLIGRLVWPGYYAWATWPIVIVLNLSWLALGLSTLPFWRLRWRGVVALAATLGTFIIWWVWFFPSWLASDPPLNPEGSGYMLSKALLAVFIAIVLWDGRTESTEPKPITVREQIGVETSRVRRWVRSRRLPSESPSTARLVPGISGGAQSIPSSSPRGNDRASHAPDAAGRPGASSPVSRWDAASARFKRSTAPGVGP